MRSTLFFTVLRFGLFIVALGLLRLAGARSFLLLGLAIVVSGLASLVLLKAQRAAMAGDLTRVAGGISRRITGFRTRLDAAARAEDVD
ncbi:MAG TPA: DUF4229 domain-containing protein [Streptosporangiaceae bacterium]|nr:DUF4229 domain-containing protein [Streptosporangiaceae bacterium]